MRKRETVELLIWGLLLLLLFFLHGFLASTALIIENKGISWGVGEKWSLYLAGGVWLILFFWIRERGLWGIKMMLVGGAVNLLDRLIFGVVRDYWPFLGGVYNNVADWLIGAGLLFFMVELWRKK